MAKLGKEIVHAFAVAVSWRAHYDGQRVVLDHSESAAHLGVVKTSTQFLNVLGVQFHAPVKKSKELFVLSRVVKFEAGH